MKKIFIATMMFAASCYAEVNDQKNFYVRLESGVTTPSLQVSNNNTPLVNKTKFRTTGVYGGAIGYRFLDYFRIEMNPQYRNLIYKAQNSGGTYKQHTKNWSVLWNAYADWRNSTIFTPYFTAGIGYSRMIVGGTTNTGPLSSLLYPGVSTNNFAWNGGAGLKTNIWQALDLDISYKYVELGQIKFKNAGVHRRSRDPYNIHNHEVTFGLSYSF